MNISRKWLREFVDIEATDKEYDDTMGLISLTRPVNTAMIV